jgi:hypothetical protein
VKARRAREPARTMALTEGEHPAKAAAGCSRGTSHTRVIISASQIKKPAMITRVSGVIRPEGLGDLRSPV